MIKELAEAIKSFSPQQWGVVATLIAGTFGAWYFIEERFAKKDPQEKILNHLISIDSKISAIITTQYDEKQIETINKAAARFEENFRKYHNLREEIKGNQSLNN